jgi:hypothetical protein
VQYYAANGLYAKVGAARRPGAATPRPPWRTARWRRSIARSRRRCTAAPGRRARRPGERRREGRDGTAHVQRHGLGMRRTRAATARLAGCLNLYRSSCRPTCESEKRNSHCSASFCCRGPTPACNRRGRTARWTGRVSGRCAPAARLRWHPGAHFAAVHDDDRAVHVLRGRRRRHPGHTPGRLATQSEWYFALVKTDGQQLHAA